MIDKPASYMYLHVGIVAMPLDTHTYRTGDFARERDQATSMGVFTTY